MAKEGLFTCKEQKESGLLGGRYLRLDSWTFVFISHVCKTP